MNKRTAIKLFTAASAYAYHRWKLAQQKQKSASILDAALSNIIKTQQRQLETVRAETKQAIERDLKSEGLSTVHNGGYVSKGVSPPMLNTDNVMPRDVYDRIKEVDIPDLCDPISAPWRVRDQPYPDSIIKAINETNTDSGTDRASEVGISAHKTRKEDHIRKEPVLLGCPFCGSDDVQAEYNSDCCYVAVECDNCQAVGPAFFVDLDGTDSIPELKKRAINAWNERHTFSSVGE